MRHRWIAAGLVAAALGLPCRPAAAQLPEGAPAARAGAPRKAHGRKAAAKPAAPSPTATAQPPAGSDGMSSLERRRRAFFAKPDDTGAAAPDPTPPVGVTLGGSSGLTPGMGFKF